VIAHAWKAQHRLYTLYHRLAARRPTQIAVVATARELVGFLGRPCATSLNPKLEGYRRNTNHDGWGPEARLEKLARIMWSGLQLLHQPNPRP
jgi:hypothetical protein